MLAAVITLLLFALLAIGAPVGFAMAIAGSVGLLATGGTEVLYGVLATAPASALQSYELITVPMFILMAEFMVISGITDDLFRTARTWVGRAPGGLAIATAFAGAGFGALSGSSTASAATLSATTVPAMLEQGYEPKLATGVVAISGTLAMLIPPSIALVLFGIIADVNIGDLLIGGVLPGLLVTATIVLTVLVLIAIDPRRAPPGRSYSWHDKLVSLRTTGPALALLLAVTGSIYLGVATPTEASALGALGALVITLLSGRASADALVRALVRCAGVTCMILMIILGAKIFGFFFALTRVTQDLVTFVGALEVSRWSILAIILAIYFALGFFMDQIAILVLTVPVALPLIEALGFDPVWFGVIVVVLAEVGLVTPPLGLNVFVVAKYTERPVGEIFAGVAPHVGAHLVAVALLVVFPQIVLWLPMTMSR
ncbi:MAG: TRAP transporter large permease [Burkholderiales bacterium]|nr:MAG: TRAP transporter large permease [Burkholderiales bacterium]